MNAVDPARIYVSGEITTAWDSLAPIVRAALDERTLAPSRGRGRHRRRAGAGPAAPARRGGTRHDARLRGPGGRLTHPRHEEMQAMRAELQDTRGAGDGRERRDRAGRRAGAGRARRRRRDPLPPQREGGRRDRAARRGAGAQGRDLHGRPVPGSTRRRPSSPPCSRASGASTSSSTTRATWSRGSRSRRCRRRSGGR